MASPTVTGEGKLGPITRKGIGKLLQGYSQGPDTQIINCFFLQLTYSFRKWINDLEIQRLVEEKITNITDEFLEKSEIKVCGRWYRVEDDCPLTYFLDAQKDDKGQKCLQRNESWFDFEEYLNRNVRQKLRKELKEKDSSFRDMPVKIMRACKYVRDVDDIN